ncbi:MAG: hypothetical protein MUE51_15705 [Thermoleophilia bacterium]|jgi:hypothetical protein|nr:hypothetical protein [Thermoleophilia bacterium]
MSRFIRRPSPATVISVAALVMATTGGAVAATAINGNTIIAGTVGTSKLANGAVTAAKIRNGAVGTPQLRAGSVGASQIANGSISSADLGASSVSRSAIQSRAVNGQRIATGTITSTNIAPAGISRTSLAADARLPVVVTRFAVKSIPTGVIDSVIAQCASGEVLIAGGFAGLPATITANGTQANVLASRPEPLQQGITPTAWFVSVENASTSLAQVSAYAVCAQQ